MHKLLSNFYRIQLVFCIYASFTYRDQRINIFPVSFQIFRCFWIDWMVCMGNASKQRNFSLAQATHSALIKLSEFCHKWWLSVPTMLVCKVRSYLLMLKTYFDTKFMHEIYSSFFVA